MLYKPDYCCNCGNKIERTKWKLWTSRRFCEDCAKDFQKEEWLPRIVFGLAIIAGIFGFGTYLKSPEKPLNVSTNQAAFAVAAKVPKPAQVSANANVQPLTQNQTGSLANGQNAVKPANLLSPPVKTSAPNNPQNNVTETVYFCGAQTKKGTACTRRVRGGGRCWQHTGQPAMLAKEKLVANQ